ncbi:hypothetical protein NR798_02290 [Archangium gephyra]|uniref:hypothetical protein n=1 Tax=Archangium gephyra TaxID=48 RepID=UPI0035D4D3E6
MKLIQSDAHSVTARHLPWGYWLVAGLLAVAAFRSRTPGLEGPLAWMLTLLFLAVALVVLGLWGQVVTLTLDSRRRVAVVRRFGLLGARPTFIRPLDAVSLHLEHTVHRGNGATVPLYRLILQASDGESLALTPHTVLQGGVTRVSEELQVFLLRHRSGGPVSF